MIRVSVLIEKCLSVLVLLSWVTGANYHTCLLLLSAGGVFADLLYFDGDRCVCKVFLGLSLLSEVLIVIVVIVELSDSPILTSGLLCLWFLDRV